MTDANIWIDLHNADLLAAAFELDHTWRPPDVPIRPKGSKGCLGSAEDRAQPEAGMVSWTSSRIGMVDDEVLTVSRDRLLELGLDVRPLSGNELNRIPPLNRRHSRPSPIDLAILVVADVDDGIVGTGDGPLRSAAQAEGLTVHGVLWMLDQMVEENIVPPERAAAALTAMIEEGSHLPERPVQTRLRRWQSTD